MSIFISALLWTAKCPVVTRLSFERANVSQKDRIQLCHGIELDSPWRISFNFFFFALLGLSPKGPSTLSNCHLRFVILSFFESKDISRRTCPRTQRALRGHSFPMVYIQGCTTQRWCCRIERGCRWSEMTPWHHFHIGPLVSDHNPIFFICCHPLASLPKPDLWCIGTCSWLCCQVHLTKQWLCAWEPASNCRNSHWMFFMHLFTFAPIGPFQCLRRSWRDQCVSIWRLTPQRAQAQMKILMCTATPSTTGTRLNHEWITSKTFPSLISHSAASFSTWC